ncbi:hypothetical protein JTB14_019386 [Gonioctena quinquepunctata]|nr:hypothetical protein JTB14_019386 [Gonioctena quinquepunctata]
MFATTHVLKMITKPSRILRIPDAFLHSFENNPYDLHRIEYSLPVNVEVSREDALFLYKWMTTIRRMENTAANLYQRKIILGFCHLYAGQEACAVGIKSVMSPQDTVITSYRCHAWTLLMGAPLEKIYAELLGKITGVSKGKGGSMHLFYDNMYGGHGIVGAHVPLGTGIAFAHQYKNDGGICFTAVGDGAMDQGQVYEAMNFAKLQNLPIIYIVENNQYSMGTSSERHSADTDYYTRGGKIPGIRVDGMDVLTVREVAKFAVQHIKDGKGPILLELVTYRYYGHSMSDPGTTYRTRDEVKDVRDHRDCIKLFAEKIRKSQLATEDELKTLDSVAKKIVDAAVDKATKDDIPDMGQLATDIHKNYSEKVRMPAWNEFIEHKKSAASATAKN